MFRNHNILLIALCLLTASLCHADEKQAILLQTQIFRITNDVSGDMSLTEDIWAAEEKPGVKLKRALSLFTIADLKIGENKLKADKKGWAWDETPIPLEKPETTSKAPMPKFGDRFRLVAAPALLTVPDEVAVIKIASTQPIEFFEKREENIYELKNKPLETGLELKVKMRPEREKVRLEGLTVSVLSIGKREPLVGVTLPVGKPIQQKQEMSAELRITPNRDYGLLFSPSDGSGLLLIRIKVTYGGKIAQNTPSQKIREQASTGDVEIIAPRVSVSQ